MNLIENTLDAEYLENVPIDVEIVWTMLAIVFSNRVSDDECFETNVPIVSIRNDELKSVYDKPPFEYGEANSWLEAKYLFMTKGKIA